MFPECPSCEEDLIPIHYGDVTHADIQRVIIGVLYIGKKYGLENFYCRSCELTMQIQ